MYYNNIIIIDYTDTVQHCLLPLFIAKQIIKNNL